jgi:hypothetical protein
LSSFPASFHISCPGIPEASLLLYRKNGGIMPIDPRLIGFWNHAHVTDGTCFEITPAGKYFVHDNPFPYKISRDGTELVMETSDEKMVYLRMGSPTTTLAGAWAHTYPEYEETETFIFNDDGSYVNHWDGTDYSVGFYVDHKESLQIIEFRGTVSTDQTTYRHETASNDIFEYRYEFSEDTSFNLYDIDSGQLESVYHKKSL